MTEDPALAIYAANADTMARRYDSVTTDRILTGLTDLIPPPPAPVLDIGAGSGRDTAWFQSHGHAVTAAEPVAAFREMIARRVPAATVVNTALPDLAGLTGRYGLILVNAVWHHLDPADRTLALGRLADLLTQDGRVFLALRRGPVPPGAPLHDLDPETEIVRAKAAGLQLLRRHDAPAHDAETAAAGIGWTWLALGKDTAR
ncbi:bifunctional 2-polyprenyl-6-hydroxyphenol methylase/3-demethylubiquinol 3-O-methyltransferase UbiG [Tabrizicola sp.]|uniref:class I SAM-dependent methyltransferase n=1 Tax=Tabrizicola sp. TaxID=2005166 RepID=UPI002734AF8A|nr:class I SAM-dependent methyltransferase [Tabrizicola sp.]MDP3196841.1 class I SAM-dependent methyltransferase [Tabrizicola sp.]